MALKKYLRYVIALFFFGGAVVTTGFLFNSVRNTGGEFKVLLGNIFTAAISFYLLAFLALLIIRYAIFILYSVRYFANVSLNASLNFLPA